MKRFRISATILLVIIATGLLGGLFLDKSLPTQAANSPNNGVVPDKSGNPEVIRFYFNSRQELDAVSSELDIWEVHQDLGYAVAEMLPAQQQWLQALGYRVEVDAEKTALLQSPNAVLDPNFAYFDNYFTNPYDKYIVNFMQDINTAYPDITELIDIGDAWLGAVGGGYNRNLVVMRITNEDPQYGNILSKPPFFLLAGIHAREVAIPEIAMRYIAYLTTGYLDMGGYDVDADVTWLVNHNVVYILTTVNPDGHVMNEQDINNFWRKNVDNDDGCGDPNSWGVDLNRNSSFKWGCCGGSSGSPCAETYRGWTRASEPETDFFQTYFASVIQDQNGPNGDDEYPPAAPDDTTGIFITLHSYADLVLWPWGHTSTTAPNGSQMQTIGRKFAYYNGFTPQQSWYLYTTDGTTDDWTYGKFGVPSYTFEIGPDYGSCGGFFPAYNCIDGTGGAPRNFWGENRPALLFAHKIARTPYLTSYGPDTQNLGVDPYSVVPGDPINLSGNIMDHRYIDPVYPISAAEYFIDAPGADGAGIAMSPSDGNWGGTSENVQAVVDTTGLTPGRHYILVHGLNNQGDWGPFTAIFINVLDLAYGVSLQPESQAGQADLGQPITYTLQVNNIGQNTDTYSMTYNSNWPASGPASVGPLNSGENAAIDVVVTIPLTATPGTSDLATITATGTGVSDSAFITTTANLYDPLLTPTTQSGEGYPGNDVIYQLQVTNNGNITDTYDLSASGAWTTTLPATLGPLAAGDSAEFPVNVIIPPTAMPGDNALSTITLTSQGNGSVSRTAEITTTSLLRGPVAVAPVDSASADPGSQVSYTIIITNVGDVTDTYGIITQSGWDTQAPTTTIPLATGESTSLEVTVTVPISALAGVQDIAEIQFNPQQPNTLPASVILTTTANQIYGLSVNTDALTQYGRQGQQVLYTFELTNTGNGMDWFDLTISSTWTAGFSTPVGPLDAGESTVVTLTITIPLDAASGEVNDATLTVTSQGDSAQSRDVSLTTYVWYSTFLPLTFKK